MILQDLLINFLFLVGVVFLQVLGSLALMGIEKAGVLIVHKGIDALLVVVLGVKDFIVLALHPFFLISPYTGAQCGIQGIGPGLIGSIGIRMIYRLNFRIHGIFIHRGREL